MFASVSQISTVWRWHLTNPWRKVKLTFWWVPSHRWFSAQMFVSTQSFVTTLLWTSQHSKIRTNHVKIRALESRAFTVTLDRDHRRAYRDVQRWEDPDSRQIPCVSYKSCWWFPLCCSIEISPCVDPAYCVQKTLRSKYNASGEKDGGLSKYLNKGLTLPVNTFAGIVSWHDGWWRKGSGRREDSLFWAAVKHFSGVCGSFGGRHLTCGTGVTAVGWWLLLQKQHDASLLCD